MLIGFHTRSFTLSSPTCSSRSSASSNDERLLLDNLSLTSSLSSGGGGGHGVTKSSVTSADTGSMRSGSLNDSYSDEDFDDTVALLDRIAANAANNCLSEALTELLPTRTNSCGPWLGLTPTPNQHAEDARQVIVDRLSKCGKRKLKKEPSREFRSLSCGFSFVTGPLIACAIPTLNAKAAANGEPQQRHLSDKQQMTTQDAHGGGAREKDEPAVTTGSKCGQLREGSGDLCPETDRTRGGEICNSPPLEHMNAMKSNSKANCATERHRKSTPTVASDIKSKSSNNSPTYCNKSSARFLFPPPTVVTNSHSNELHIPAETNSILGFSFWKRAAPRKSSGFIASSSRTNCLIKDYTLGPMTNDEEMESSLSGQCPCCAFLDVLHISGDERKSSTPAVFINRSYDHLLKFKELNDDMRPRASSCGAEMRFKPVPEETEQQCSNFG